MAPVVEFSERTGGNDPADIDQVKPAQLEQLNCAEYATLTVPFGNDEVLIVGCASAIEAGRRARRSIAQRREAAGSSRRRKLKLAPPKPKKRVRRVFIVGLLRDSGLGARSGPLLGPRRRFLVLACRVRSIGIGRRRGRISRWAN